MKEKCTYCNKSHDQVKVLIVAPKSKALICESCIAVCVRVVTERLVLPATSVAASNTGNKVS